MFSIYASHKTLIWIMAVLLPLLICVLHYLCARQKPVMSRSGTCGYIRRFNIREMILHWLVLLLFLTVASTGMMQIFGGAAAHHIGPVHGYMGLVLVILFIIGFSPWFKDAVFKGYDFAWLSSMGGYFSADQVHLPAGRFNAGQKIFFWLIFSALITLLTSTIAMEHNVHGPHSWASRQTLAWSIHGLTGCMATAMVIGHAYLSVLANPQTARVLCSGKVARSYAEQHHSRWAALKK